MNINNRNNAHNEIDRVFKVLLPTRNMAERPAQVALSHQMLDGGIALCDAGTGIGKTYAYLVAGTAFSRFRAAVGYRCAPSLSQPPASPCKTRCGVNICRCCPIC